MFHSILKTHLAASLAINQRKWGCIYRANGTDKSSEASLPFLITRLMRHRSSQLLQLHSRSIERYGVKFQALGIIKLSWCRS